MDPGRFDHLARLVSASSSRRAGLGGVISALLALFLPGALPAAARRDRRRNKDRDAHRERRRGHGGDADGRRGAGPKVSAAKKKNKKKKGKPAVTCKGGAVRCGNACVNTKTDRQHCGACGHACGKGRACTGGSCACPCTDPLCFLFTFGGQGAGSGQFLGVSGVAVAPDDQSVYVTDPHEHRIKVFAKNGSLLAEWGEAGSGEHQLDQPSGVAVTADTVYVADFGHDRIQVFSRGGVHQTHWGGPGNQDGQFSGPFDVAVAPNGEVYVTDAFHDRVQVFNAAGTHQRTWGSSGSDPGQLDFPFGIALSANGQRVYVADSRNDRIQVFDPDGIPKDEWGGEGTGAGKFDRPHGVAVAADGIVYVGDADNNRLQAFSAGGGYLGQIGSFGEGDAQFDAAYLVATSADTIYVTDLGNARVQAFCRGKSYSPCAQDSDCGGERVCCEGVCCTSGQVCHQHVCCTPSGICAAGFCGPTDDACGGQYECPCDQGLTCCDSLCVDTKTDPAHCGGCGDPCGSGGFCCHGACCAADQVCHQNACCTPSANCAGNSCGPSDDLCGGVFPCLCDPGLTCCDFTCVDLGADLTNCGACGHECDPCETCDGGQCVWTCAAAETCCDGVCKVRTWVHQTTFGSGPGSGSDQFNDNREVTVSPDGRTAWIAEYSNHRISIWTKSNGSWSNQTTFGSFDQFDSPQGMAVSADQGTIWVANTWRHEISIWAKSGNSWVFQTGLASTPSQPYGFLNPSDVAVAADEQTFWVANTGLDIVSVWKKSGGSWVHDTFFGSQGSGPSQFRGPAGVAVSADGQTVWVCDRGNHRISVWTKTGSTWATQTTFGSLGAGPDQFNVPQGLAVSADEQTVWIADYNNHRISVWAKSGGVWGNLTTFGTGPGSGDAELNLPPGIAVSADGETAWVADWLNSRVSIWALECPA